MEPETDNVYMLMPLERVRQDAKIGVSLARIAWRQRDPDGAAAALGHVMQPESQPEHLRSRQ